MILLNKIRMPHSETHNFALEVLDLIDQLIRPEIKSSWIERFWGYFTGYAKKKILKKPEHEITEKLLIIQRKLNSRFEKLSNSVQINTAEALGSVPIPNVGELARTKQLTKINKEQALQLMKELKL